MILKYKQQHHRNNNSIIMLKIKITMTALYTQCFKKVYTYIHKYTCTDSLLKGHETSIMSLNCFYFNFLQRFIRIYYGTRRKYTANTCQYSVLLLCDSCAVFESKTKSPIL